MNYPFEYFCGANVLIYLQDFPLLEASGFSYSIRESKRPIFGYSSRHFDAVARGQVLVEGTLLINYVHQDYLYHAARLAASNNPSLVKKEPELDDGIAVRIGPDSKGKLLPSNILVGKDIQDEGIAASIETYWKSPSQIIGATDTTIFANTSNLHDQGGFEIRISFGDPTEYRPAGDTGLILRRVHFTGRAKTIQIDAETVVEAYSFIARDIGSTINPQAPALIASAG